MALWEAEVRGSGVQGPFWLNRDGCYGPRVACHKSCSHSRMSPQELSSWWHQDTSLALTGVSHGGSSLFLPWELPTVPAPSFLPQPTAVVK